MSTTLPEPPRLTRKPEPKRAVADEELPLSPRALKRLEEREKLRTSKFDVVSAFLMALMWFIGVFALMLFIIWVTSRISFGPRPFPPIIENPPGRGENAEGFERDFDPPGAEEVSDLAEPTLQDTITAVTDAASSVAAVAATSESSGRGDSRPPGPEAEGDDIIPRHERWELQFAAKNAAAYAQQLDFYKFELGAIGGGIQGVDYASNLAGTPQVRRASSDDEKRLYFMWVDRSTPLYGFDRQLLQKAGISLSNRETMKFVDPETENMLAHVELEFATKAGHPSVTEIQKTIFQSVPSGTGYAFEVVDQRYRKPKR